MRSHSQTYLERLHGRRGELKIGHQVSHLLLLLHECPLQDSVHGVGSCGRRAQRRVGQHLLCDEETNGRLRLALILP
jgi:hypothetical protein